MTMQSAQHNETAPAAIAPVKQSVPEKINAPDIINLTARLAQLLAEEADLLTHMNIGKIGELQQEKMFLTGALESHRRLLVKYPHLKETISHQERQDMEGVVQVFEDILTENHRRLLIAREANRRVVNTITKVVRENATSSVYDASGIRGALGSETLSVTLNQTA